MRKSTLSNTIILGTLLFAVACKPRNIIVKAPSAATSTTTNDNKGENLALLKSKDLPFNTLSLKGKATLDINGEENNVTMNIRIQKDKKIWLSVTGIAGIEGARAVITPDSLLIRNNLQKTLVQKPFSYIHNFTNKQVTFALLQSIFSGNTIGDFMVPQANLIQENGVFVLSGANDDLTYRNTFNTLYKIAESTFNDAKAGQSLKVSYGDYTPLNKSLFPSSLNLLSRVAGKRIGADIIFNKIEANVPVEFPFSVPKSYQLIK